MDPDTKHQQNDADLGQLVGHIGVGDEARRERSHGDASQQVANKCRYAQVGGDEATHECDRQTDGDGCDEAVAVDHGGPLLLSSAATVRCSSTAPSKTAMTASSGTRTSRRHGRSSTKPSTLTSL